MKKRRVLAASAIVLVLVAACAPPPKTQAPLHLLPSPSPTPTTAMAAAAPSFHIGEVGVTYSPVAFTATGGLPPYKWSVVSGGLPGGLTIGADGSVSGTPTAGGDFTFTVAVADSGTQSTTVDGKISIAAPLTASLIPACARYCNVELGCVTACGTFGSLSGGVAPYDFKLLGGDIPAGTSVVGFSLTGTFTGQTGWVQFTVQASDSLGATSTIAPKFWMYSHISFGGGSVPVSPNNACFYSGAPNWPGCTGQFPYSGGTPNAGAITTSVGWLSNSCATPAPLPTVTAANGLVTVSIPSGTPTCNGYQGSISVVLTDQDVCGAGPTHCSSAVAVVKVQQLGT